MDYQQIAVGVHLVGFALGLGGATISDVMFFRALRKKQLTDDTYSTLNTLSRIIWIGLGLLILSGLTIFALIYSEQGHLSLLASPRWQAKLILVGVVLINGFVFKMRIFPFLKNLIGQPLSLGNIGTKIWALVISGTISILSWYSILIISLLPRTFRPPLFQFLGVYVILLVVGILMSKALLTKTLKS